MLHHHAVTDAGVSPASALPQPGEVKCESAVESVSQVEAEAPRREARNGKLQNLILSPNLIQKLVR